MTLWLLARGDRIRRYVILHMHFWRVLVFLIYIHVLQQAYEIPGYFYHTLKKQNSKKKFRKNFVWETAEKRLKKRRSNARMSLPLNFSAGDFVFASAPHLFFLNKKRLSHLPLVPQSTCTADPFFCGFVRNAWGTPGAIHLYGIRCILGQVTSSSKRGYHVGSGITPPFPSTY